uniref:Uncharacterized protein n=1 Tax=Rhipicephalus microplus TaxID=6941 RepID=A0A6G5AIP9_RHIMP
MQNEQFENIKIRDHLNHSKLMNRVQNYGILNLYGWQEEVENYTINTVPSLLKTLRNLLGDDRERRKVFVGIGYYLYNTSKAWAKLEDIAEHVITPAVDVPGVNDHNFDYALSRPVHNVAYQCLQEPGPVYSDYGEVLQHGQINLRQAIAHRSVRTADGRRHVLVETEAPNRQ